MYLCEFFIISVFLNISMRAIALPQEPPQSSTQHCAPCSAGHSLGGALATLAAFEIRKRWPEARMVVYTFGCPRVVSPFYIRKPNQYF